VTSPAVSPLKARGSRFLIRANLFPIHCDEPGIAGCWPQPPGNPPAHGDKMTFGKALLACIVCSSALVGAFGESALAGTPEGCKEPETGTKEIPAFSPPTANVVVGAGRLQFYMAPNVRCPMDGVFVIPKDELIAYTETNDGWSSVMYLNPRTGNNVSGWVRSAKLKERGTVGPKH
jgi:hypothetical protein